MRMGFCRGMDIMTWGRDSDVRISLSALEKRS